MNADDFYRAYTMKHEVNVSRQEDGYHAKDEDDSRHI